MRPIDIDKLILDIKSNNDMNETHPTWRSKDVVALLENIQNLPNNSLTLEELQDMDGEPVWVMNKEQKMACALVYAPCSIVYLTLGGGTCWDAEDLLDEGCKIYRYKPDQTLTEKQKVTLTNNDYTTTFPVHLGQTIWVDSTTLPTDELAPDVLVRPYFKAEVRGLKIHIKGDTARKSIQFRVKARWRVGRNQYATTYKNFSYAVSGLGKTIFTENPVDRLDTATEK